MRKALMGMILAATALAPAAAWAQDWHNRSDRDGGHQHNQNEGDSNGRGERSESRHEERQVQQQQPQVQQPQAPAVQNNNRGNHDGNRGGGNDGNGAGANNGGGNGGGDRRNWRGGDNNRTSVYPQAWQGDPNDPRLRHYQELERRNQNGGRNDWRDNRNDRNDVRNDGRGGRDGRNDWRDNDRHDRNWRNDWNRNWRNDNRFDWTRWRYSNRNIFHLSPYYSPYRNWGYQRFSIGFFLEPLFFDQRYWIGDPYDYRLPAAPYGTQWVRYYNDVVLVDLETGEIVDVIYDFFW